MSERLDIDNLVKNYFNVCNTALAPSNRGPVTAAAVHLLDELVSGEVITLEMPATGSGQPACYTTKFVDGQFTPPRRGTHDPDARLRLDRDFLEDVARNADHYIQNPEKLDWSWLRPGTR